MSRPHVGDYVLFGTLGAGTTGKVKLAEHSTTHEKVAIKIIKKAAIQDQPDLAVKIRREISLMRLFRNPHLLRLVEVCESAAHLYIILEYAEHGELFDRLTERGALTFEEGMRFFRQIIYGLEFLHLHGICHRDLKPENILLDSHDTIKIADFGFARWMRASQADTSCGSPHYAAPEIIKGETYDGRRSDIWSVGVILYTLLSGRLPFDDTSIRVLLQKVKTGEYCSPDCPDDIQELIRRMLEVDPAKRIALREIKESAAFRRDLPPLYIVPTPLPPPHMREPVDATALDPDIREVFRQLGYEKDAELDDDLLAPMHTMAKVFFRILKGDVSWDSLPWDPVAEPPEIPAETFAFTGMQSFGHWTMLAQTESIQATDNSVLDSPFRDAGDPTGEGTNVAIDFMGSVEGVMAAMQEFLTLRKFAWFHPDEGTLMARRTEGLMDIEVKTEYDILGVLRLQVMLRDGDEQEFGTIVAAIQAATAQTAFG
jgi:BR serine/threonine kinase